MDGLITILILFGLYAVRLSNKSVKKMRQQQQKQRALIETAETMKQEKIPFSKDEWTAYLKEMDPGKKKSAPIARKTVETRVKNVLGDDALQQIQKAVPVQAKASKPIAPAPAFNNDHDEPEGTVSTQGESAVEHARHRQKVLGEEARLRQQQETLQELRHLNRQKLRSAVVMSEVLGKPVSLRPRGYR